MDMLMELLNDLPCPIFGAIVDKQYTTVVAYQLKLHELTDFFG